MADIGSIRAGRAHVEVTADDKTEAGLRSAEQRIEKYSSRIDQLNRAAKKAAHAEDPQQAEALSGVARRLAQQRDMLAEQVEGRGALAGRLEAFKAQKAAAAEAAESMEIAMAAQQAAVTESAVSQKQAVVDAAQEEAIAIEGIRNEANKAGPAVGQLGGAMRQTGAAAKAAGRDTKNFLPFEISQSTLRIGGEIIRIGVAMRTFAAGMNIATGIVAAFKGEFDKLDNAMKSLPLGIGAAYSSIDQLVRLLDGSAARLEKFKKALQDYETIVAIVKQLEGVVRGAGRAQATIGLTGFALERAQAAEELKATLSDLKDKETELSAAGHAFPEVETRPARQAAQSLYAERMRDIEGREKDEAYSKETQASEALLADRRAADEAQIRATTEGYAQRLALMKNDHLKERMQYSLLGRDKTELVRGQLADELALRREMAREVKDIEDEIAGRKGLAEGTLTPAAAEWARMEKNLQGLTLTREAIDRIKIAWDQAVAAEGKAEGGRKVAEFAKGERERLATPIEQLASYVLDLTDAVNAGLLTGEEAKALSQNRKDELLPSGVTATARGTFNPMAWLSLVAGGTTVAERTAKATEKTASESEKLNQKMAALHYPVFAQ